MKPGPYLSPLIPAKAGTPGFSGPSGRAARADKNAWVPAFAGMSGE